MELTSFALDPGSFYHLLARIAEAIHVLSGIRATPNRVELTSFALGPGPCYHLSARIAKAIRVLSGIRRGGYATNWRVGTWVEFLAKSLFEGGSGKSLLVTYQGSHRK